MADLTYRGNPLIKGVGVVEEWTKEQVDIYRKCMLDPFFFCREYGRVLHLDRGLIPFELYPYQEKMIRMFENNRFSIVLACRQSGKTMALVGYVTHKTLFTPDTSVLILANKERTAKMIMSRVMRLIENVPFFLQPGAKEYNKSSIVFENGSMIQTMSTTSDSARGECVTGDTLICVRDPDTGDIFHGRVDSLINKREFVYIEDLDVEAPRVSYRLRDNEPAERYEIYRVSQDRKSERRISGFRGHNTKSDREIRSRGILQKSIENIQHGGGSICRGTQTGNTGVCSGSKYIQPGTGRQAGSHGEESQGPDYQWRKDICESGGCRERYRDRPDGVAGSHRFSESQYSISGRRKAKESGDTVSEKDCAKESREGKTVKIGYGTVQGKETTEEGLRSNIQRSEGTQEIAGVDRQDQSQSRENTQDGGKASWNEAFSGSAKENERSGKATCCPAHRPKILSSSDRSKSERIFSSRRGTRRLAARNRPEVLTQEGFKPFDGIKCHGVRDIVVLVLSNGRNLGCTPDHRVMVASGDFVTVSDLRCGDVLHGGHVVAGIRPSEPKPVYDAMNVQDTVSYLTNGIVSHNSVNLLVLDEFAFAPNANEFYTSVYPIISSGETTKVIITSTANSVGNPFHRLYMGSKNRTNNYVNMQVDWWDVPGRDEEWKKETIANTSERQFRQEFGNSFEGSTNTLISGDALLGLKEGKPVAVEQDGSLLVYQPPEEGHFYVLGVDTSRGRGLDYSAFSVIDVTDSQFKQVATYRDNLVSPLLYPTIIQAVAKRYNDAFVIVENNDVGGTVADVLFYELEYDNLYVMTTTSRKHDTKQTNVGLNMNKRVKHIGCSHLKDLVESGRLEIIDPQTILELSTFIVKGTSWEAAPSCNDDTVMALVVFSWFASSTAFGDASDVTIREMMYQKRIEEIENDLLPFIGHDDGLDGPPAPESQWPLSDMSSLDAGGLSGPRESDGFHINQW